MRLISYNTWKKHNTGNLFAEGYCECGGECGYGLFKSVYPKDVATIIIHTFFTEEECEGYEFVYWPHPYKGVKSKEDTIEIWCKKIK